MHTAKPIAKWRIKIWLHNRGHHGYTNSQFFSTVADSWTLGWCKQPWVLVEFALFHRSHFWRNWQGTDGCLVLPRRLTLQNPLFTRICHYSSINTAYKIVQSKAQTKVPRLKWWQQVQKCFNSESHASNHVTAQTQHLWFMTQLCFMGYTAFLSARNRAFLARIYRAASWQSSLVEFKNSLGKLKVEQSLCSLFHHDVLQLLHIKTDSPCHWSVWCCKRCIAMPCEAHQRSSWRAASAWFISHQHVKSIQRQSSLWP